MCYRLRFLARSGNGSARCMYFASTGEVMDLSVVIPVKNEAENIEPLVNEIRSALQSFDYEIIYVDDGSTDDTPRILQRLRQVCPQLRIIRHKESCGQSTAITTGVRGAKAPVIAMLDGDGQNDPGDIPRLFTSLANNESHNHQRLLMCVCGYRRKRNDTWLRRLSSRIANRFRSTLLNDDTPDTGCGLKVFLRDEFLRLPYFDHMHRFLPALFLRAGGSIVSIEVNHRSRERGVSKYGLRNRLWVGIVDIFGVMWLQRRAKLPVVTEVEG